MPLAVRQVELGVVHLARAERHPIGRTTHPQMPGTGHGPVDHDLVRLVRAGRAVPRRCWVGRSCRRSARLTRRSDRGWPTSDRTRPAASPPPGWPQPPGEAGRCPWPTAPSQGRGTRTAEVHVLGVARDEESLIGRARPTRTGGGGEHDRAGESDHQSEDGPGPPPREQVGAQACTHCPHHPSVVCRLGRAKLASTCPRSRGSTPRPASLGRTARLDREMEPEPGVPFAPHREVRSPDVVVQQDVQAAGQVRQLIGELQKGRAVPGRSGRRRW